MGLLWKPLKTKLKYWNKLIYKHTNIKMKNGFIKIDKRILEWGWYQDTNTFRLWIHLLLKANWKDSKFENIVVKRGQLVTSVKNLSKDLELTTQQIRTSLKKLKETKEISEKTTNKFTLINIENYCLYQDNKEKNNKQITNEQQTNNKQITTNKNDKNKKNDKNINLIDKSIKEQSSEIMKEDKRIIEIDLIIETLKELNWWIIDDKVKQQRIFWKNIKNKFDKLQWFNGDYVWFIKILYQNSDEYRRQQFRSAEKFYYNIAGIIAGVKTQIQTKTKTVSV